MTSLCWLVLLGGCLTLGLRMSDLGRPALLALGGLNPVAALLGIGVVVWAVVARRGALLLAAALLGATQIWVNTPLDAMTGCGNDQADGDLVVLASNVYFQGATADQAALMIIRSGADVVALSEVQPHFFDQLVAIDEISAAYPYRFARPDPSPSGIALLSRYPISEEEVVGRYALRVVVDSPSGPFVFEAIHAMAPVGAERSKRGAANSTTSPRWPQPRLGPSCSQATSTPRKTTWRFGRCLALPLTEPMLPRAVGMPPGRRVGPTRRSIDSIMCSSTTRSTSSTWTMSFSKRAITRPYGP
ncbi:MAG: hypothetical protein R2706_03735 [Acidimicrobiales bacterium]